MPLAFLQLPPEERRLYFEQAAAQRNLSPVILEKAFWVCWLLSLLFESKFGDALVFKGGTSLSKVFRVIERFSEDIDLSVSPEFLRISEQDVEAAGSRNQRDAWMDRMQSTCLNKVRDEIQPEIERTVVDHLGRRDDGRNWLEFKVDESDSPVLLFHYPTTQKTGFEYLLRSVKLELGSLTDQRPTGRHAILPWIADTYPQEFDGWRCEVVALELQRSFWEKATILHVEYYRRPDQATPVRCSRHYADTAALALNPIASAALASHELRERVVEWKSKCFASRWARYDLARPDTFKLVPPEGRIPALRSDYAAMRDMYLSAPMEFDQIMQTLAGLETQINQARA